MLARTLTLGTLDVPARKYLWGLMAAFLIMAISAVAHARSAPDSFADLAKKLLPSVVNISTTQVIETRSAPDMPQFPPGSPYEDFFKDFFDRNQQPGQKSRKATSLGSGFIIDTNGSGESYVVTNNHVIQGADEVTVVLQDNTRLEAEIIGRDPKTDLAVLKVKSSRKLPSVKFGDSNKTRVGDWILAIGNPFGLGGTVTAGIVSARGRDINAGPYDNFIQTDASINRGNSGGPMFNMDGQVIGINTAIFSPTGGSVGIGFAIPSSTSKAVVGQLLKHGEVSRGWLGVHIQQVTDEIAETLGLKKATGALVSNVIEGGPAADGGIQTGDVILKFAGRDVTTMRKLPRIVAATEADKAVDVVVWRKGSKKTLKVTVGRLDNEEARAKKPGKSKKSDKDKGDAVIVKALGLRLSTLTPEIRERLKLAEDSDGVVVVHIDEGGPAAEKGIRPGDIIREVSQKEVDTPEEVKAEIEKSVKAGRKSALLLVEGQGGMRFIAVRLTDK